MKRFAIALLAGVMVLGSTALGDEIVLDDGFAVENEAIEASADAELEEEVDFTDYEEEFFAEDEFVEVSIEENAELEFSEDDEDLNADSLIEDFEETADEDALALADDGPQEEGVLINATNFPDEIFMTYVSAFNTDGDELLSFAEINAVATIDVRRKRITDLKGIECFTALKKLYCSNNQLESLDVSSCTALEYLYCSTNKLTSLDVSGCTALKKLDCYSNQLESLDVSHNTALEDLECNSNQLTTLDVSNSTALTKLECSINQLTSLKVSGCTALEELVCSTNQLTGLEVSGCTALEELYCEENQLASLDVSNNMALKVLYCSSNQLTSLDISNCQYLVNAYSHPTSQETDENYVTYEYENSDDGISYSLSYDSSVSIISGSHTHTFGEWTITTPATCTTTGVRTHKCTGCDAEESEIIPATGIHTPVTDPAVAATATSTGLTEGSHCSVCGTVLIAQQTIPKIVPDTPVTSTPEAPVAVPDPITVTKKPSIKKPEATANKITINWANIKTTSKKTKAVWKKIKKTQIQCATDKAFKNIVKTTTVGKNKTKAAIKGLKKNTTYYVRVRYYDGTGYSKWSSVKKIKTKKK